MREAINENATYFRLIETTLDLEDQLSIDLPDKDISGVKTVNDLVEVTARKCGSASSEIEAIVISAVQSHAPNGREIRPDTLLQFAFQEYNA